MRGKGQAVKATQVSLALAAALLAAPAAAQGPEVASVLGIKAMYLLDPEGNAIEIAQKMR